MFTSKDNSSYEPFCWLDIFIRQRFCFSKTFNKIHRGLIWQKLFECLDFAGIKEAWSCVWTCNWIKSKNWFANIFNKIFTDCTYVSIFFSIFFLKTNFIWYCNKHKLTQVKSMHLCLSAVKINGALNSCWPFSDYVNFIVIFVNSSLVLVFLKLHSISYQLGNVVQILPWLF